MLPLRQLAHQIDFEPKDYSGKSLGIKPLSASFGRFRSLTSLAFVVPVATWHFGEWVFEREQITAGGKGPVEQANRRQAKFEADYQTQVKPRDRLSARWLFEFV